MPSVTDLLEVMPTFSADTGLHLGHRFAVVFFMRGWAPNPIDIRFESVSGLSSEVSLETIAEGGQNLYSHRLPTRVQYGNLVLRRGRVMASWLSVQFNATMSLFRFKPDNVLVMQLDQEGNPVSNWLFFNAYPVRWSTADLDASKQEVLVDTMELAYQRFQTLSL